MRFYQFYLIDKRAALDSIVKIDTAVHNRVKLFNYFIVLRSDRV